ncbi:MULTISPECIES: acyl-CoA thioesterase [Micromonospora]|uniref:Enediyne biosynthesis thioesterase n=1 Tax=Micromonospora yangpuensis TaxID=683228 RepID=A0A1C6UU70_9ACTN|nr:acyl-CoA thioesterase [Micromonospora yangpuensis]GGM24418.1 4-hydroxybenzoyl-CoA thioesterase [Micromonospora yangpuensis]SCL57538.1 enediyne biosynthesis thioesterase [Micromonospora yangpuensis]
MAVAYVHSHRVTFDETNLVGNVYFAHYLHWQGHCREHFLAEHAPGVLAALDDGLALVTLECSARFYAEGRAMDQVEIRMELDHLNGHRVAMCFDYVRVAPGPAQLIAQGNQSIACMRRGPAGLEPVRVPQELQAALTRYQAVPR